MLIVNKNVYFYNVLAICLTELSTIKSDIHQLNVTVIHRILITYRNPTKSHLEKSRLNYLALSINYDSNCLIIFYHLTITIKISQNIKSFLWILDRPFGWSPLLTAKRNWQHTTTRTISTISTCQTLVACYHRRAFVTQTLSWGMVIRESGRRVAMLAVTALWLLATKAAVKMISLPYFPHYKVHRL